MRSHSHDDEALLAAAAAGDDAAFATFFLRYQTAVFGLLLRRTRDRRRSRALAAATFAAALRRAHRFDPAEQCASAWLLDIAAEKCADPIPATTRMPDTPPIQEDPCRLPA